MCRYLLMALMLVPAVCPAQESGDDVWRPLRFLEGVWSGTGEGLSGRSTVTQRYSFILGGKFLQARTRAAFPKQERNPDGELHEDMGVFSYDRARKKHVLRAFYVEGFVNQFVLEEITEDGRGLTFVAEAIENAPEGTSAKLVYKLSADGVLTEQFFVAFPGQELSCFSSNTMTKKH
ncbi:MAG TPA: hypothetical protein QGH10_14090 [Armatimonadota bacterium]|nr:hypothetical protein [Armatimonadota bacterium]